MATKLKNTTRHWFFKWAAWLLIMILGLNIIWSTYFHYTNNQGADFTQDYGSSSVYYKNLDSYYQKVYTTYFPDPAHPNAKAMAEVNGTEGYYYLIALSKTNFKSNVKNFSTEEDFYAQVYAFQRIDSEQYREYHGGEVYFNTTPPKETTIYVGMDPRRFQEDSEAYRKDWYAKNMNWIGLTGGSLAAILFLMIYLAAVSGRKPESDEVHFNELDRIFLDVYLVLWFAFEGLFLTLIANSGYFTTEMEYLIGAMVFCVISGSIGLHYWTMVAKRIKSRTMFNHTLASYIFRNTFGKLWGLFHHAFEKIKDGPKPLWSIAMALIFMVINIVSILTGLFFMALFGPIGFILAIFSYISGIALLAMYLIYQDQQVERATLWIEQIEHGAVNPSSANISLPSTTKQFTRLFQSINHLADDFRTAVSKEVKAERMKSELITNVSHDIRTPLTSIITYVDLLKTKGLNDPEAMDFVNVLDQKSQRLKQLTDDLFEASKASSRTLQVNSECIKLQDFMLQAMGEFEERFDGANLDLRSEFGTDPIWIIADGRHLWRTFENLFLNICKYALPQSRVYLTAQVNPDQTATITLKNISADPLNLSAESFLERFSRGDVSRNTEGSGLGLSIAKSLTELMKGSFQLETDGDLFKVMVTLPTQEQ